MTELLLGPMLRHVTPTSATIWLETDAPCDVEVLGTATRTFTVGGHHFALVILRDLEPESTIPYEVRLDGRLCWPPPGSHLPPSVIRTKVEQHPVRLLFGSCRAAAPHEPPYCLELDADDDARGVDALWALAHRMVHEPPDQWPDLAVFVGDQIYADDSSPYATERMERRRERWPDQDHPPDDVVADFEEYTWLYREAWTPEMERWFFSVVPSAMIFDDHDVIDDWNISAAWVDDIRREPWWEDHVIGGFMSYLVYQHLGNLSPEQIEADGLLEGLMSLDDGEAYLRRWAEESEAFTPVPGRYRFSHARDLAGIRIVVLDDRNARVLDPHGRRMVDDTEWQWFTEQCLAPCEHLVIATSLPIFVSPGVHGLQQWNEAICDGRWGKRWACYGERLRRELDLEDWSAFRRSFDDMVGLMRRVTAGEPGRPAPRTTTIIAGDIHLAYVAGIHLDPDDDGPPPVTQVVSSPIRNALVTMERGAMRFATGAVGSVVGRGLARLARCGRLEHRFDLLDGPEFSNNIGWLEFDADGSARAIIDQAASDEGAPVLDEVIRRALPRAPA